jgi:hypothetical protein
MYLGLVLFDLGRLSAQATKATHKECFVCTAHPFRHLASFQKKDPAGAKKVYKMFCKSKDEADKERSKVKFGLYTYFEALETTEGYEYLRKGEMMWESEYIEFTKTAKAPREFSLVWLVRLARLCFFVFLRGIVKLQSPFTFRPAPFEGTRATHQGLFSEPAGPQISGSKFLR